MSKMIFIFKNRNNHSEGYRQVTEAELQEYKRSCTEKVYLIPLGYAFMEVVQEEYRAFYKELRREKYLSEEAKRVGEFSYNALDTDEYDGASFIPDKSEAVEDKALKRIMNERLYEALAILSEEEYELIQQIYFANISERELSGIYGVSHTAIQKRRTRIILKLKNYFEI
ncbi:MAG: sigma-70 family RNA polymerase sigma factor [Ruminococcus sp.]|nr:sigma-70 family RNA polymerase sigma factor [Ruminococcus sp.]